MSDELIATDLVDLTGRFLDDVAAVPDGELSAQTRRLLDEVDNPKSSVGGYNS